MKSKIVTCVVTVAFFAALAKPTHLTAQNKKDHNRHHSYKLIDVGTLGGPNSYFIFGLGINKHGTVVGIADTSLPDPFAPNCFLDCFVVHVFQ